MNNIKENYEDYSSGRVLYGAPGATNFSVSLSRQIFEICSEYLTNKGNPGPYVVYDPFCGAGYSMTVLGFLYGHNIKEIIASDIDKTILEFANKNLSLLSIQGMIVRVNELKKFIEEYKKACHKEALKSAECLQAKSQKFSVQTKIFEFNILSEENFPKLLNNVDIVIADAPYGKLTDWVDLQEGINPIQVTLDKIKGVLSKNAIIAIVVNKKQEISYEGYSKIKSFKFGKRKVILLELGL